jgi:nitrogen-specific signal transduction histidine kinase
MVFQDATERRRAENEIRAAREEAESANRAKDQFLAVLSHELRTPLNPILLAATSMLERPAPPEDFRPTMEMIRQNVNLQARLIDDLLDVMRIVRGKMPLHWEVADAHVLVRQAARICQSEVSAKGLRLEMDLGAQEHYLNADPARFQQVIWNLVRNAVKFTPGGGAITIRTGNRRGEGGERLVIEVADTGIGIEPDIQSSIFEPFQQGETRITRKFGGLGLGLAICRGIVEAHGGLLEAESEGKDRGATFRIDLKTIPSPAATDGEPTGDPSESPPADTPALKILVVEDDPATRRLMARLLRGLGHEVTAAGTVAEGVEAAGAGPLDLIVSDIGLPDGSGLELMRRVVAARGKVRSIALTGYGMEEDIVRSREAGFTAHMTKPIDFTKLEAMIRQVTS